MTSILDTIVGRLNAMAARLTVFINQYTTYEVADTGDGSVLMWYTHFFKELSKEALPKQNDIFGDYEKLFELIKVLLHSTLQTHKDTVAEHREMIMRLVKQDEVPLHSKVPEAIAAVEAATDGIVILLQTLFSNDKNTAVPIIVPDTNAIYHNGNPETWRVPDVTKFKIALTTTVLKEIDKHKNEHRVDTVREKAKKFVKKIKEYRGRGELAKGVNYNGPVK